MYLCRLAEDGLIEMDKVGTGWLGIKVFREVYEKLGREGMTVIAMSADYQSIFRYYNRADRFIRSVDEIFDKRSQMRKSKLIDIAVEKYEELQYNTDLEQERINNEIKIRILGKVKQANLDDDDTAVAKHNKALQVHEGSVATFNKRFDREKALEKAVTTSGYELTRIERDINSSKKSKFVHHGKDLENPDNLKLEQ